MFLTSEVAEHPATPRSTPSGRPLSHTGTDSAQSTPWCGLGDSVPCEWTGTRLGFLDGLQCPAALSTHLLPSGVRTTLHASPRGVSFSWPCHATHITCWEGGRLSERRPVL